MSSVGSEADVRFTYTSLFLGVGNALRASLETDADDTFGAAFSVEMLEDYAEPRKLRDLV